MFTVTVDRHQGQRARDITAVRKPRKFQSITIRKRVSCFFFFGLALLVRAEKRSAVWMNTEIPLSFRGNSTQTGVSFLAALLIFGDVFLSWLPPDTHREVRRGL